MRTTLGLSGCLVMFAVVTVVGQPQPLPIGVGSPPPGVAADPPARSTGLTRFDLDFPGGTPNELVAAIQKASGRPPNVIVPEEFAATRLPALKMKNVNVGQLFQALAAAGEKHEQASMPGFTGQSYQRAYYSYGFRQSEGAVSDDTIWYFYAEKARNPSDSIPKVCRFYSLARYIDAGTTVDDITTAIKTGAKMLAEQNGVQGDSGPAISFHKDTKLLIAVGEPSKLEIIDAVLQALGSQIEPKPYGTGAGRRVMPVPDEKK